MRIPSRHIEKPATQDKPVKEVKTVERIVEVKDNSEAVLTEIKGMLGKKSKAPTYIFDIIRDESGSAIKVIATPFDSETII